MTDTKTFLDEHHKIAELLTARTLSQPAMYPGEAIRFAILEALKEAPGREEVEYLRTCSMTELAARNPNAMDYVTRADKAFKVVEMVKAWGESTKWVPPTNQETEMVRAAKEVHAVRNDGKPDKRPANCRHRLQDEGKSYPRSGCAACGKTITTGLGRECTWNETVTDKRQPPRTGDYPDAAMRLMKDYATGRRWLPSFDVPFSKGITAAQAREAAHLLNQLAEYLEQEQ